MDNNLSYTYSSEVANAEINQRFKLFSYDPYHAFSWLWGVRYFHLSDDLTLSGSDISTGGSENLAWRTDNNLIGLQAGINWTRGWDRFQLCAEVKGGLFANIYSQHGTDSAVGTVGFQPYDISHGGTDLSALFEVSLLARFRLTECLWLRAGYQAYAITGLALAPRQLSSYDSNGSLGLDGLSLGWSLTDNVAKTIVASKASAARLARKPQRGRDVLNPANISIRLVQAGDRHRVIAVLVGQHRRIGVEGELRRHLAGAFAHRFVPMDYLAGICCHSAQHGREAARRAVPAVVEFVAFSDGARPDRRAPGRSRHAAAMAWRLPLAETSSLTPLTPWTNCVSAVPRFRLLAALAVELRAVL